MMRKLYRFTRPQGDDTKYMYLYSLYMGATVHCMDTQNDTAKSVVDVTVG